jgi:hypothetical protein
MVIQKRGTGAFPSLPYAKKELDNKNRVLRTSLNLHPLASELKGYVNPAASQIGKLSPVVGNQGPKYCLPLL